MEAKHIIRIVIIVLLSAIYCSFTACKKDPELPTVKTGEISAIGEKSATGSGEVTDDGGATVSARGVCWSTSPEPTIMGFFMNAATGGTGSFSCNIIGLESETKYYVRAFAINEVGVAYGNSVSFTTLKPEVPENVPILATMEVSEITATSAASGGVIASDGGETVIARGVCWSESSSPTIEDNKTTDGAGAGSFTSEITGLKPNTTYFLRAYATNANGTGYGSTMSFKTLKTIPQVTTTEITDITPTTAVSGGNVTKDGGAEVTARGVCWSTNPNPFISYNNYTNDGEGLGSFTSNITNLTPGYTYYVRAYATNSEGTAYGEQKSFTASANVPTVNTNEVSSISFTTAVSGGSISTSGGVDVIAKGICWSTSQDPTIADQHTDEGSGTGSFISNLTDLVAGTTYYVRAYATNSEGTGYGNTVSFTTKPPCTSFTDSRDGNTYQTVIIGDQCWMAENLAYLPIVHNNAQAVEQGNQSLPAYGVYDYNGANTEFAQTVANYHKHGVLYNAYAAETACPTGWYLPSDDDWKELEMYLGMTQSQANATDWRGTDEGGKLKSTTDWESPNTGATNSSGFSALPSGRRRPDNGLSEFIDLIILLWTSEIGTYNSIVRSLHYNKSEIYRGLADNKYGAYIRCLRE